MCTHLQVDQVSRNTCLRDARWVPATASTYRRVLLATPDSRCRRFSAVCSAVSSAQADAPENRIKEFVQHACARRQTDILFRRRVPMTRLVDQRSIFPGVTSAADGIRKTIDSVWPH